LNIPLHIAEQGKEKIEEYVRLINIKDVSSRKVDDAIEGFEDTENRLQDLFIKEEKDVSQYHYRKTYKKRNIGLTDKFYNEQSESTLREDAKNISQFIDQVHTLSDLLQESGTKLIQSKSEYLDACLELKRLLK
jgi:hypothetical protein